MAGKHSMHLAVCEMIIVVCVNKLQLVVVSRGKKITTTRCIISQKSALLMPVFCEQV